MRRVRFGLRLHAGDDVELDHPVIFVGGLLGGLVALALLRDDVDEDRPLLRVAHVLEHRDQVVEIMPVDRTDVIEAKLLEQGAAGEEAAGVFLDALRFLLQTLRHLVRKLQADVAQRHIGAAGDEPREIAGQRTDRRCDRHVVVVEDDDQA